MSFLNPVNEPVLRFKSTDAGAPQINYAARTAGDVKAVLKACLVTGYGTTESAGWTAVNEIGEVCEFVSPSTAMSDYRLGIDDRSASSTTWYYQYQDVRTNPTKNTSKKSIMYINTTNSSSGWQLIVTNQGMYLVEMFYLNTISNLTARLTYWGAVKSALIAAQGANIAYWQVGYESSNDYPSYFFSLSDTDNKFYRIGSYSGLKFSSANLQQLSVVKKTYNASAIDTACPLYLVSGSVLVGEQAGLLVKDTNSRADLYGVADKTADSRPVLSVSLGGRIDYQDALNDISRVILIYLDYWGY